MGRLVDRSSKVLITDPHFFNGDENDEEDAEVMKARRLILSGRMGARTAKQYVDCIEKAVIDSTYSFCMHLAALTASFPEEVSYRAPDGRTLSEILHTATSPSRIV